MSLDSRNLSFGGLGAGRHRREVLLPTLFVIRLCVNQEPFAGSLVDVVVVAMNSHSLSVLFRRVADNYPCQTENILRSNSFPKLFPLEESVMQVDANHMSALF